MCHEAASPSMDERFADEGHGARRRERRHVRDRPISPGSTRRRDRLRYSMIAKRILVVRVGRAGDMVMITPALEAVLARYPEAEIHALTSTEGTRVLQGFDPRLTRMLLYERRGIGSFLERGRVRREVAAGGYSYIYCFETNPSYRRLFETTGVVVRMLGPEDRHLHFAERCLRLVHEGPSPKACRLWLPLTEAGRTAARTMLAAADVGEHTFVVGLHPSFSGVRLKNWRRRQRLRQKAWPLERFGMLARRLKEHADACRLDLRIIVDLLPVERPLGENLVQAAGGCVTLFTEPPDFERYKATIARMNLLVTPNTGPMHIAAALGTPVVALFAEFDPNDCGPYTDAARYAVLRAEHTTQPDAGLSAIPVDAVFEACRRFVP
jgi:heptosyltransferase I